jgi:membrane-associated phospholipid phosphatase
MRSSAEGGATMWSHASARNRRAAPAPMAPAWLCAWVSLTFASAYSMANRWTSVRGAIARGVFDWERAIPFIDWMIVPYLSIVVFFVWSFFVDQRRDELARHVMRLLLVLMLSLACYAAFPLRFMFERPATYGAIGLMFELLSAVDLPYNRAPSLHIGVLVILWARFAPRLANRWRVGLHLWFALIALSVLTTYQHHVIDVPAGLLVGALCLALTGTRRRQAAVTASA